MSEFQNNYGQNPMGGQDPYKVVIEPKSRSKAWSVAALILSIASIMCCCVYWVGLVCGALGIIFAVISRRSLGYFDGLSIASIIVSIFGLVFSVLLLYVALTLENNPEFMELYNQMLEEYMNELESGTDIFRSII